MALKVKAKEKLLKFSKQSEGTWRYVMVPDLYSSLAQDKVIREAALRSGVSQGVMQACWDAAGQVIKAWATEGHSVALPGLGTMRFGLSATAVENVNDVKSGLIKTRRIIFTPSIDLKDELKNTAIVITCYDRNGTEVKRVTSSDDGTVENNEDNGDDNGVDNGSSNGGSNGGSTSGNSNSGSGSQNSGSGTQNGGSANSGSTNSGSNSGSGTNTGSNEQGQEGDYRLVIYKYGNGTSTVTDDSEQEINSNDNVHSGSNVNISVVPVEGKEPIAKVNGNRITLTENDGVYTGSFQMPTKGTVLEINDLEVNHSSLSRTDNYELPALIFVIKTALKRYKSRRIPPRLVTLSFGRLFGTSNEPRCLRRWRGSTILAYFYR